VNRTVAFGAVALAAFAATLVVQNDLEEPEVIDAVATERSSKPPASKEPGWRTQKKAPANKGSSERDRRDQRKDRQRGPRELSVGMKGPDVRALQTALADASYDPGPRDGSFGYMTQHAVIAFEKVKGLERDGVVTVAEAKMVERSGRPATPAYNASTFVDIDITRQVLFEVVDGKVIHTLPISTANGATYQSRSGLAIATTPRGEFSIYSKTSGWRTSYLGSLYSPSYFYGGYAIHGSTSVPPYPASHGCVRIPMHSTAGFFERNPLGTTVYVHD
jgi:N-acetylmuramoyl-L-alanine amidase